MREKRTDKKSSDDRLRIYLAGPDVFLPNAAEVGRIKKSLCEEYGFAGVFPADVEIDTAEHTPREAGLTISDTNERLILECDLVVANITPFRGPSADVGTAYEMGFARASGLPVFAYTNIAALFTERTVSGLKKPAGPGRIGRLVDHDGMAIEEWGLVDNLMLEGCVVSSGGRLVIEQAPDNEVYTYLGAFEKCLELAGELLLDSENRNRRT